MSNLSQQLEKHFRDVYFGGNWTAVNLKEQLENVSWQQATTKVSGLNTIVALVYHISYYVTEVSKVLEGNPLTASDKFAFDHPPIQSYNDWENMKNKLWKDAEKFAALIGQLPEQKLFEDFSENKYGTYYRNLQGIVEHTHYHLGQIVLIKKMLAKG